LGYPQPFEAGAKRLLTRAAPDRRHGPFLALARIIEELDDVVRKSHRRSVLGRMLHRVSSAFARLWSRMVPEPPQQQSDLSLEIWFPWFFL
jgi:hypothetical protein